MHSVLNSSDALFIFPPKVLRSFSCFQHVFVLMQKSVIIHERCFLIAAKEFVLSINEELEEAEEVAIQQLFSMNSKYKGMLCTA